MKEIAKVTDSKTNAFTPNGTMIDTIFQDIYYNEKNLHISVNAIDIDYHNNFTKDQKYKIYQKKIHIGLGWDYDEINTYNLDSSILVFSSNLNNLNKVFFQQLTAYDGYIILYGNDVTGEGSGDDEQIQIYLNLLPFEVKILTVQINSFRGNSLRNVKSAYIRISSIYRTIGTYSINKAGNNLGLLIGFF